MPRVAFQADYDSFVSRSGEPLSAATIAIYKAALNHIAKEGYANKEALLANQSEVIEKLETRLPDKAKRRVALSAIFRVLQNTPNEHKSGYYHAFKRATETPV